MTSTRRAERAWLRLPLLDVERQSYYQCSGRQADLQKQIDALQDAILQQSLAASNAELTLASWPSSSTRSTRAPSRIRSLNSLPAGVEVAVYRIVEEALTNVVRHACAGHYEVRLELNDGCVHLAIADDDLGLPAHPRAGVGLTSMRERAEELGGKFAIGPRSPHGTRIQVNLPLSNHTS
jgi:two-component system, NarL family, sensor kinase